MDSTASLYMETSHDAAGAVKPSTNLDQPPPGLTSQKPGLTDPYNRTSLCQVTKPAHGQQRVSVREQFHPQLIQRLLADITRANLLLKQPVTLGPPCARLLDPHMVSSAFLYMEILMTQLVLLTRFNQPKTRLNQPVTLGPPCDRLLDPHMDSSASLYVGNLITQPVRLTSHNQS